MIIVMQSIFFLILLLFTPPADTNTVDQICLSNEEKKLVSLINKYRKTKNLDPIPISAKLSLVAQTHARDLSTNYDFDPNGQCNPHSWSSNGDWSACCYTNDHKQAECMWNKPQEIAGYQGHGYEIAYYSSSGANAEGGIEGWKKSKGHNPLLINSGIWKEVTWNAIGVGIYREYAIVWFGQVADDTSYDTCL